MQSIEQKYNQAQIYLLRQKKMNFSRFTPQLPQVILEPEEIYYRHKHHRNWGIFKVFKWKNGNPQWFIPSFVSIAFLIIFYIGIVYRLCKKQDFVFDMKHVSISLGLIAWSIVSLILFLRKDPNISSTMIPITDDSLFRNQANFCEPCKLFKQEQHFHCSICKVCLKNQYFHCISLGCCITSSNIKEFVSICLSLTGFCLYILFSYQ